MQYASLAEVIFAVRAQRSFGVLMRETFVHYRHIVMSFVVWKFYAPFRTKITTAAIRAYAIRTDTSRTVVSRRTLPRAIRYIRERQHFILQK